MSTRWWSSVRLRKYLAKLSLAVRSHKLIGNRRHHNVVLERSASFKTSLTPKQQAARQRALERMRRGFHRGGAKFDREELYDERCGVRRDEG